MAVSFDNVASSSSTTTGAGSLTWAHNVAASANLLLVAVSMDSINSAPQASWVTVTAGGVSMTQAASSPVNNGNAAGLWVFELVNPPTGSSVSIIATNAGGSNTNGIDALIGGSLSFIGYSSLGTPVTVVSATGSSVSVTVNSVASTSIVAGFCSAGDNINSPSPGTSKYIVNAKGSGGNTDGNSAGAINTGTGTVTITWGGMPGGDSNNSWGVEVQGGAAAAVTGSGLVQPVPPAWFPSAPGAPGSEPFTAWPLWLGSAAGQSDSLNAAQTVTATAAASLVNAPSPWELPPQFAPGWFPGAPAAPGGEPFTAWQVARYGVNSDSFTAAQVVTATGAAALTESKPVNAAQTVTASRAAALTESKPLNAAATVTATGAAADTTSKPLNAVQTVTATAAAAMTVSKAGVAPAPLYPPRWFPAAPGAPGTEPFTPWPPWTGSGVAAPPVDALNAAQTVTATGAAALTESKPLNAASTVTATGAAALTTAKPLNAAQTVTAGRAAAETSTKTLTAAQTVTATGVAALADMGPPSTAPPKYAPGWFPGAPGLPVMEPFTSWPPRQSQFAPIIPPAQGTVTITLAPAASVTIDNIAATVTISNIEAGTVTIVNDI